MSIPPDDKKPSDGEKNRFIYDEEDVDSFIWDDDDEADDDGDIYEDEDEED